MEEIAMPTGVMVNSACVLLGGIAGTFIGKKLDKTLCERITLIFGVCSMTLGINSVVKMQQLPAVILAVILGTIAGECLKVEDRIAALAAKVEKPVSRLVKNQTDRDREKFMSEFISIVVLFCASGTGIFGALHSGITGDHTILFSKAILDFFTAAIFAAGLGIMVALVAVPQFLVMIILFFSAVMIMPLTNEIMLADFTACGGVLMLATGFRISGIKWFPIANMIPAMILVMPFSWIWMTFIA